MADELDPNHLGQMAKSNLLELLSKADELPDEAINAVKYELSARGALEIPSSEFAVEHPFPQKSWTKNITVSVTRGSDNDTFWGCFVLPAVILSLFAYVFWYAPTHESSNQNFAENDQTYFNFSMVYPGIYPRMVRMQADNLDVYIPKAKFEADPYPDRIPRLEQFGKTYGKASSWYLFSAIRFRDMTTGDVLATYSCNTGQAALASKSWW